MSEVLSKVTCDHIPEGDSCGLVVTLIEQNAKLRKLVRDYIDAPCTTCDCWQDEFRCWNYDGADCGLVARARELGVEVD